MNVSAGKMSCTSPHGERAFGVTRIPAMAMYFAHAGPTMRARRLVPPLPAIAPSRTSGTPNSASGMQNRKSHDPPISTPAPRQMPLHREHDRLLDRLELVVEEVVAAVVAAEVPARVQVLGLGVAGPVAAGPPTGRARQ